MMAQSSHMLTICHFLILATQLNLLAVHAQVELLERALTVVVPALHSGTISRSFVTISVLALTIDTSTSSVEVIRASLGRLLQL